LAEIYHLI